MSAPFDVELGTPSAELLEVARQELRETPELRAAALAELRTLLNAATDLSFPDDDEFLLIYLRPTHFYAESALKLVSRVPPGVTEFHSRTCVSDAKCCRVPKNPPQLTSQLGTSGFEGRNHQP